MTSVDVIVPCYRYGHFLRQCVESVLAESVQKVRVRIIDDASPDNTAEVAADLESEDSRVTFVRHIVNKGHIATYNEGIEWATADYLLILSADDYLLPGALSRAVNLMDAHPEVGFVFGNFIRLSDAGAISQVQRRVRVSDKRGWRILTGREFIELTGASNFVASPTAVVRTILQKRLGGYRPELPHSGDMEMWLRLSAHASVGFVKAHQAVYRRHSENMSKAYIGTVWLPDLQQRKAALECFLENYSNVLPDAQQLHRRMFWSLARITIGCASAAFANGEIEISNDLCGLALEVCPKVKRSLSWIKFAYIRHVGSLAGRSSLTIVSGFRKVLSTFMGLLS